MWIARLCVVTVTACPMGIVAQGIAATEVRDVFFKEDEQLDSVPAMLETCQ